MKRLVCVLMACLLFLAFGAPAAASGLTAADVRPIVETVSRCVSQADGILEDVRSIIAWQIEGSEEQLAAYREALRTGEEYVSEDNEQEVIEKAEQLGAAIERTAALAAEVNALRARGVASIDATVVAGKTYFAWIEAALKDLMSIFDFYFDQSAALEAINGYDSDGYSDMSDAISDLYYIISDMGDAMDAIACPPFMQECYGRYVRTMRKYLAVLESMYTAVYIEDVLRSASASYLIGRMGIEIGMREIELTELFNLQYEKVRSRLDGDIATLGTELKGNCATLLAALEGGAS